MIRAVFACTLSAFALGGTVFLVASRHADAATRRTRSIKLLTYFAVVHVLLAAAFAGRAVLGSLLLAIGVAGGAELRRALTGAPSLRVGAAVVYVVLASGLVGFGLSASPPAAAFVYLVVAAFDGFSQVAGQLLGAHQLAPTISPRKTVEGSAGGAAVSAVLALGLRGYLAMGVGRTLTVWAVLVCAALAGDLAASWLKRSCAIKDFGALLPGHGGVLDRFDSLLVAAPVALLLRL